MAFLRSKSVSQFQLILPRENAHRIVEQIGRCGNAQFKHYHRNPNERPYLAQVKLCEETLQRIRVVEGNLFQQGLVVRNQQCGEAQYDVFLDIADRRYRLTGRSNSHLLESVVEDVQTTWKHYQRLNQRKEELKNEKHQLKEEIAILLAGRNTFGAKIYVGEVQDGRKDIKQIKFKCGVLDKRQEIVFKRTIFRISRGFCLFHSIEWTEIFPILTEEQSNKFIFFLFHGYGQSEIMQTKILKLFENYQIRPFNYPSKEDEFQKCLDKLNKSLLENQKLCELVDNQCKSIFRTFLEILPHESKLKLNKITYYKYYLLREKKIYEELNEMKGHHSFYEAQVFIESDKIEVVTQTLQNELISDQMPAPQFIPQASESKPTLFDLNDITRSSYQILSAYGVPHYKEINPSIFNIVTFPFLFGIMFGDIAHGALLFAFGLSLILQENKYKFTFLSLLLPHRYTIALMGFFSLYCGLVYNEFLSINFNIFGSCYNIMGLQAILKPDCVYPFGVDPIWSISTNSLNFTNSLKMKIAVIIAIVHMTFGLFIKICNVVYEKQIIYIFLEVIPQILFFVLMFGYMDLLIVYKWLHQWEEATAPSIITTMINIPLRLGKTDYCCGGQPMWGQSYLNTSQNRFQLFILIISVLCVPIMLFGKPLFLYCKHNKKKKNDEADFQADLRASAINEGKQDEELIGYNSQEKQQIDMSEIYVHQLIETIEFVLGCISNTASYLRLWALSLAHSQLSQVFFTETVQRSLPVGFIGIPLNIVLFPIFASITFGILICMDTMQCFLHTLRLHWVQFQNKFYKGDGKQFVSLDFRRFTNDWMAKNDTY